MLAAIMAGGALAAGGLWMGFQLRRRSALLRAWQQALLSMHAACAYARSGSAQVLRAGSGGVRELYALSRAVELSGADAGREFMRMQLDRGLRDEEGQTLMTVMRALSDGGREEQQEALRFALERFSVFCDKSDVKRDHDAGMYMTLGLLGGLCAFLILC